MKPNDPNLSKCIGIDVKSNHKNYKFKIGDHLRIPKYEIILKKRTLQIGLNKF